MLDQSESMFEIKGELAASSSNEIVGKTTRQSIVEVKKTLESSQKSLPSNKNELDEIKKEETKEKVTEL